MDSSREKGGGRSLCGLRKSSRDKKQVTERNGAIERWSCSGEMTVEESETTNDIVYGKAIVLPKPKFCRT